jgi:hypothetical protein
MRFLLFWDVMQCVLVVFKSPTLEDSTDRWSRNVDNYQPMPCNIAVEAEEITHSSRDCCFHHNSHKLYGTNHVVPLDPTPRKCDWRSVQN